MADKPVEHFLVPKHFLLTKEQAAELLNRYNLTLDQLPRIGAGDAGIDDFKAERGDIVKIIRESPTAGKTVYYRRVV